MTATKAKLSTAEKLHRDFAAQFGKGAEQFPATPTVVAFRGEDGEKRVRFSKLNAAGKERQRNEDGRPVLMFGDIARFGPEGILAIRWPVDNQPSQGHFWAVVPSTDALMEWTMDSVCETPDGREVEPDADDSWLRLLGLV